MTSGAAVLLRNYLNAFSLFEEEDLDAFCDIVRPHTLLKGDFFIREGTVVREVAFVVSGILRSFYISGNGQELTYCLTFPRNMMTAYSGFITGGPSSEHIQALTDAELLLIPREAAGRLAESSIHWMKFMKIMAERQYMELEKRVFQFQRDSAQERYKALLLDQPEYIRHIPLQHLASYLGITPRHLSRLRKAAVFLDICPV